MALTCYPWTLCYLAYLLLLGRYQAARFEANANKDAEIIARLGKVVQCRPREISIDRGGSARIEGPS